MFLTTYRGDEKMNKGALCPNCNTPLSYKRKGGEGQAGCGCALTALSFFLFFIPVIGFIVSTILFVIGIALILQSHYSRKEIPYCDNCGWEGK